jgi:hypothetical protein
MLKYVTAQRALVPVRTLYDQSRHYYIGPSVCRRLHIVSTVPGGKALLALTLRLGQFSMLCTIILWWPYEIFELEFPR